MRPWLAFTKRSLRHGWDWLVQVANHAGVVLLVLYLTGAGYLGWRNENWTLVGLLACVALLLVFSVGAYKEWRKTERAIGEVALPSITATLQQLRSERGRANAWLKALHEANPGDDVSTYEWLIDAFWLQTLEQIIKPRSARSWAAFTNPDYATKDLEPVAADDRERVLRRVRDLVARLDTVIAEFEETERFVRGELGASR